MKQIGNALNSHSFRFTIRSFRAGLRLSLRPSLLLCGWARFAAMLAVLAVLGVPAALAQVATTTTLALSSSSVATGTVVTFTATVRNPSLVTHGTVTFCNAAATYCEDSAIIGTAQLTSAGTASIKRVPGMGLHTYEAVFTATTANAGSNSSASPQPLEVTGLYSPAAGTIPAIGLDTLTVLFTPTDSVDYTTATASVVLTVGDFFSLNFSSSPIQTVQQGATASYSLTVTPTGLARLPAEVTFTATGLPPDATITFSPASIPVGSPATEVAITIHTSIQQVANTGSSQRSQGPAALGMLLLPMLGIVSLRKRLGKIPQFRAAVVLGVLSLGAIVGLTGCGAICTIGPQPTSTIYTVVVTAHCGTLQHSANVTVKVEN